MVLIKGYTTNQFITVIFGQVLCVCVISNLFCTFLFAAIFDCCFDGGDAVGRFTLLFGSAAGFRAVTRFNAIVGAISSGPKSTKINGIYCNIVIIEHKKRCVNAVGCATTNRA